MSSVFGYLITCAIITLLMWRISQSPNRGIYGSLIWDSVP